MTASTDRNFIECVCSKTRKTWIAAIEPQGDLWIFVQHYSVEQIKEMERQAAQTQKREELLRRIAQLGSQEAGRLQPPPQVEMRPRLGAERITSLNLSPYGFSCLHCGNATPLFCLVCSGVSCIGPEDNAGRTICIRCNTTLTLLSSDDSSAKNTSEVDLRTHEATLEAFQRTLPKSGTMRLLRGKAE